MCPRSQQIALCVSAWLRIGTPGQTAGFLLTKIELNKGNHRISIGPVWNISQSVYRAHTFNANALHCVKHCDKTF